MSKALLITVQGIGNTLLALPVMQALKTKGISTDVIVSDNGSSEIVGQMDVVEEIRVWREAWPWWRNLPTLGRQLAEKRYDAAYALCPSGKRENILLRLARAESKHGWRYKKDGFKMMAWSGHATHLWNEEEHDLFSNQRLVSLTAGEIEKALLELKAKIVRSVPTKQEGKMRIGAQPFSRIKSKCMPQPLFARLLSLMQQHFNAEIHLFGAGNERKDMEDLGKDLVRVRVHAGESWQNVSNAIAGLDFFIGVDSSVSHLSAILGIPVCVLYGATVPARTAALGKNVLILQEENDLKDAYRFSEGYRNKTAYGLNYDPERILEIIVPFIEAKAVPLRNESRTMPYGATLLKLNRKSRD